MRKNNKNLIIGIMCAVLVIMGIGYAFFSTDLNIGTTATVTGEFKVVMTNVSASTPTSPNMGTGTYSGTLPATEVNLSATLYRPLDFVTYTITVQNQGTMAAKYKGIVNNENYDEINITTTDLVRNGDSVTILQPQETATFTVTIAMDRAVGETVALPAAGTQYNYTVTPQFEQLTNEQEITPVDPSENVWKVDSNGLVISYDPSDFVNGTLTIPAVDIDNNPIVSVGPDSFLGEYNVIVWGDDSPEGAIVYDLEHYDNISGILGMLGVENVYKDGDYDLPQDSSFANFFINPNATSSTVTNDDIKLNPKLQISTLDLRNASNLTTIEEKAFRNNQITEIKFNNSLVTIGPSAFLNNPITSLTIPSSVVTIGDDAFYWNEVSEHKITTLDLSHATNLTTIGREAFRNQQISSLTIPSNVEKIGEYAFFRNRLTSVNLSNATGLARIEHDAFNEQYDANGNPTLQSIDATNKSKSQYDTITGTVSRIWYDSAHSNFHITYSDVTCDYQDVCVAN